MYKKKNEQYSSSHDKENTHTHYPSLVTSGSVGDPDSAPPSVVDMSGYTEAGGDSARHCVCLCV